VRKIIKNILLMNGKSEFLWAYNGELTSAGILLREQPGLYEKP